MRSRFRTILGALITVAAFLAPLVIASDLHDSPPPIEIFVRSHQRFVQRGTTFGEVVQRAGIHAKRGYLLDVDGQVIPDQVFPGRVVLNGEDVPPGTRLRERDRIWVVNGVNRREGVDRQVIHLPGEQPGNPQFYLGTSTGEQIVVTGEVSGKLVSSTFVATGRTHTPKGVALTFDDGPNPTYTPRILSILHRLHARATFFTIGYLTERYPDTVRKVMRAGMPVANHSWNHPNSPAFDTLSPHRIHDEMLKANLALQGFGVTPTQFRPPGGSYSDQVIETARRLGLRVVLWSVDPEDWRAGITAAEIIHNVLSHVRRGSIVILHDGGGDQSATVKALPKIIHGIRKKHLKLLTLG